MRSSQILWSYTDPTRKTEREHIGASYHAALSEATSEFVNVIEDEGIALLEWRTTADIDGKPISHGGVSIIETEGDKISAFRAYFDPRQLTTRVAGQDKSDDESSSGHHTSYASTEAQRDAADARAAGGYSQVL